MSTILPLVLLGLVFVAIILALRYFNHKAMTERVCSRNPDSEYCRKHYQKQLDRSKDKYSNCDIIYGETPSGGVKTVVCYVDNSNRLTKKIEANKVLIRELDEKGKPVFETWTTVEELERKSLSQIKEEK